MFLALVLLSFQVVKAEKRRNVGQGFAGTLQGKLIVGYQGWFVCPDASQGSSGWVHWMKDGKATVDMLPDTAGLSASELCPTPWTTPKGAAVNVYSAQTPETVERHFAWMQEYGIDGVALQRFATELGDRVRGPQIDRVLSNVESSAERHNRTFFVEYDLTGTHDRGGIERVISDWTRLEDHGVVKSASYQQHRGHPVVGLFGLGFGGDRYITPDLAQDLIAALRRASASHGGITIFAGVPADWHASLIKGKTEATWSKTYRSVDVISPWTVGHYNSAEAADRFRHDHIEPDLAETRRMGIDYMPVIFPGFSWHNLWAARGDSSRPINQIPRDCGRFYWRQFFNAVDAGSTMIFSAMFDEVDEGTAIFKTVPIADQLPSSPAFLPLNADGCRLPSDWYLRVAGRAGAVLHGSMPNSVELPMKIPR
ncbi:hypothetical protein JAO29_04510 [Edaphobacter sp. HDX4]|uniref:glycoside hydrolase family 71/99-like protein n=1 Tax=Edaphobacter sp. HDX4 TaxID=2794064 RepID=UPI002FE5EEE8